jgi:mono/diheme cytochrome c family protein
VRVENAAEARAMGASQRRPAWGRRFPLFYTGPGATRHATRLGTSIDRALVAKGAELALIGNCNSCHTREDGAAYAGGRPLETPFGTIYATNITPDPDTGIGAWSETAFRRALREGVRRDGAHLYPAFPYDHFTKLEDGDVRALYAFLMTREPIRAQTPANALPFPKSERALIAGWKLLFFTPGELKPDPTLSAELNRVRIWSKGSRIAGPATRLAIGWALKKTTATSGAEKLKVGTRRR